MHREREKRGMPARPSVHGDGNIFVVGGLSRGTTTNDNTALFFLAAAADAQASTKDRRSKCEPSMDR